LSLKSQILVSKLGHRSVKQPVNLMRPLFHPSVGVVLLLAAALLGISASAPINQPVITSLSVAGTNLIFQANLPADVTQATLEVRPTLADPWQDLATLDIAAGTGAVEFVIPKPDTASAFFRLRTSSANPGANAAAGLSAELQYVTIPSLARTGPVSALGPEAVFHFKGAVDGSDRIVITRQGALWEHVNWDWPAGRVTVNGAQWNPREKNYLTTTGSVAFLPETFSLGNARLETIAGRDVLALERTNQALIVYLNDTPSGASDYEFKIHFRPGADQPTSVRPGAAATLKITAAIDGSDVLKITPQAAIWQHHTYKQPWEVRLNDVPWSVHQTNLLVNSGPNAYLPPEVNLATARITQRKGRDLATLWAEPDALYIHFADNPNGADTYELEIAFGATAH
jgi:hypothetical protein